MGRKTRAVIYTRFSPRPGADESLSCEQQRRVCERFCEQRGYVHDHKTDYFEDRAKSGSSSDRQGLWDAVDSLRPGDVLVVRWRNRLARDIYIYEVIRRAVEKRKATIQAAEDSGNGDTPHDQLIREILMSFASYERRMTAERTKVAMLRHQRNGRIMSHCPPYGFRPDPDRPGWMVRDALEQGVIHEIVAMHRNGVSLRGIADALNELGTPTKAGATWNHKQIARVIKRFEEEEQREAIKQDV